MFAPTEIEPTARYSRHSGYMNMDMQRTALNFIGCGSVGSHLIYMFVKELGFWNFKVFDMDKVDVENLGPQMFEPEDLDKLKVKAMQDFLVRNGIKSGEFIGKAFPSEPIMPGIVISSVDTMQARREVWKSLKRNPAVALYIDTRMGLLQADIYTVDPQRQEMVTAYERTLEGDGVDDPCNESTVAHTLHGICWKAGTIVARYVRKEGQLKPIAILDSGNSEIDHADWRAE
jgi:hypothetical protein